MWNMAKVCTLAKVCLNLFKNDHEFYIIWYTTAKDWKQSQEECTLLEIIL